MIIISLLILIVAIAIPSFQNKFTPILFTRLSSIIFIYVGILSLNALYIEYVYSVLDIYSGLFHVTEISEMLKTLLLFLIFILLISWPSICFTTKTIEVKTIYKKRNLNIRNFSTSTVKKNLVNKTNNLPQYKVGKAQKIYKLNTYYLIIMFILLFILSFSIFYFTELITFSLSFVGQTEIILLIIVIVSYLISSFVFNGLRYSENIYEAFL